MASRKKFTSRSWTRTTPSGEPSIFGIADAALALRLANRAQVWNNSVPKGTLVRYFPVLDEPMKFVDSYTLDEAFVVGSELVVSIDGVSGVVSCDHVQIRKPVDGKSLL